MRRGSTSKIKCGGSKVKILDFLGTYDDFLPLARVSDEAREAKQPKKAQELKRDEGWKMSVIGCCHHYWHCDMICALVQQCGHDEMISRVTLASLSIRRARVVCRNCDFVPSCKQTYFSAQKSYYFLKKCKEVSQNN